MFLLVLGSFPKSVRPVEPVLCVVKDFLKKSTGRTYCLSNAFDGLAKHIQVIRGIRGLVMSRPVYQARVLKIQNLPKHRIGDNHQQPFVFRMAYPCGAHSCSHPDPRFGRTSARSITVVGRSSHNMAGCVYVASLGSANMTKQTQDHTRPPPSMSSTTVTRHVYMVNTTVRALLEQSTVVCVS